MSGQQLHRATFRVRVGVEATVHRVWECHRELWLQGLCSTRSMLDIMIRISVPQIGVITCAPYEALQLALNVLDEREDVEVGCVADPWAVWCAAWKHEDSWDNWQRCRVRATPRLR